MSDDRWTLSSAKFKAALIEDLAVVADPRALESDGAIEVKQKRWAKALDVEPRG